ncbi:MAG: T9SS type A sorting domain-containing protein [Schleiferiaceae bacterium]|nr:T9SS type A sorting domain-containing protein [Schleiferiaceae bacterium]
MKNAYTKTIFFLTCLSAFTLLGFRGAPLDTEGRFYVESRVISSDSSVCCFELLVMVHEIGEVNLSDVIRAYGTVQQGPCCRNLPGRIEDGVLIKDNPLSPQSITQLLDMHPRLQRMIDRSVRKAIQDFQQQRQSAVTGIKVPQTPIFDILDVEINCTDGAKVMVLITDFNGSVLKTFGPYTLEVGQNFKQLNLSGLSSGFYFLKVQQEGVTRLVPFEVR